MSRFVLTVFEPTLERALAAIAAAPAFVPTIEIRVDALNEPYSLDKLRQSTGKEMILTRRSGAASRPFTAPEIQQALEAGFDWVDVEFAEELPDLTAYHDSVILSHHDFSGAPNPDDLYRKMKNVPAVKRKIAVSPSCFAENEDILTTVAASNDPNLTVIGMGARGLYSRILAPFFGSDLIFVASEEESIAAPAQLTLSQARAIYGETPPKRSKAPTALFAVIGNPVSHSRSPDIHNPRFREAGVSAAYAMIEADSFDDVAGAMIAATPFSPLGLSITAPFKVDAYRFASSIGARMTEEVRRSRVINTLVNLDGEFVADNTDVVGFRAGLSLARRSSVAAVVGAGGAARAALVALKDTGTRTIIFNRTRKAGTALAREFGVEAKPLNELRDFSGDVIVNALPASADAEIPLDRGEGLYIDVSYGPGADERTQRARRSGFTVFDGLDFLRAQAEPQFEMFVRAATRGIDQNHHRRRQA